MSAAVTNPFKLTWGTFEVGGTTEKLITGVHRLSDTFESFTITLDILVRGTSDATFAANCAEIESEFSKRRQLILFQVGSSTIHTFNPSDTVNTGLNSYARVEKVGTPGADTDRSRLYTVTLGCEKPATDASGRRDATIVVEYDPAQTRTITISGVWTAVTTLNATAQYAAQIEAYCTSILDALLPTLPSTKRERVSQRTERDDQDKVLRFTRVYREEIVAQSGGNFDNASIVAPSLGFTRSIDQPGDSGGGGVKRLETITARFDCWLDKTVSTDLATLYRDTILPDIKTQFQAQFRPSQFAVVSEQPTFTPYTNQLSVLVTFQAAIDATDVIESVITSRIVEDAELVMTGAWTGNLFTKYADQGIGTRLRFGIRAVRVLGSLKPKMRVGTGEGTVFGVAFVNSDGSAAAGTLVPGSSVPAGGLGGALGQPSVGGIGGGAQGGEWKLKGNDSAATVKTIGQPNGDQITYTDLVEQTVEEWVEAP